MMILSRPLWRRGATETKEISIDGKENILKYCKRRLIESPEFVEYILGVIFLGVAYYFAVR